MTGSYSTSLASRDILAIMPHRQPMLMLDRVVHLEPEQGVGVKMISPQDERFTHGDPMIHSVHCLAIEALAQLSAIILVYSDYPQFTRERTRYGLLASVQNVTFLPLPPTRGVLTVHARLRRVSGLVCRFEGAAFIDGQQVVDCQFTTAIDLPEGEEP